MVPVPADSDTRATMWEPNMTDSPATEAPTEIAPQFSQLFLESVAAWSPGARVAILRVLTSGKSGAYVAIVDVQPKSEDSLGGDILPAGQYVLKLDSHKSWGPANVYWVAHVTGSSRIRAFCTKQFWIPR